MGISTALGRISFEGQWVAEGLEGNRTLWEWDICFSLDSINHFGNIVLKSHSFPGSQVIHMWNVKKPKKFFLLSFGNILYYKHTIVCTHSCTSWSEALQGIPFLFKEGDTIKKTSKSQSASIAHKYPIVNIFGCWLNPAMVSWKQPQWARLCPNKTLILGTRFWISCNFHVLQSFILLLIFFQPYKMWM
jgi:hypothetical protein